MENLYNRLFPSKNSVENEDEIQVQTQDNDTSFEFELKRAIEATATATLSNAEVHITKSLIKKRSSAFSINRQKNTKSLKCISSLVKPSSTENKRVSSLSGNLVTIIRNRLSDNAVNALTYFTGNQK
ncbi:unnamed protein product [Psylliodes chrysocephalus]|uniref:Uncharacterized protein n=1 Tax=Psylliodes chrysocephalus TaxID=3402493 RepID=A0A9P0GG98_9CUCU|nr:unnamed protein product [Psylliodes chrysocephala]